MFHRSGLEARSIVPLMTQLMMRLPASSRIISLPLKQALYSLPQGIRRVRRLPPVMLVLMKMM